MTSLYKIATDADAVANNGRLPVSVRDAARALSRAADAARDHSADAAQIAARRELCETAGSITLNGQPARISGYRNDFATVSGPGSAHGEWSWHAVALIVSKGGAFTTS